MFHDSLQVRPVVVGTTRDLRGNRPRSWPPERWFDLFGVAVAPGSSTESPEKGRSAQIVDTATVYKEDESLEGIVQPGDRVWYDGRLWEVQGRPQVWHDEYASDRRVLGTELHLEAVSDA